MAVCPKRCEYVSVTGRCPGNSHTTYVSRVSLTKWETYFAIWPVFHVCANAALFVCPFALGWHVSIHISNSFLLWLAPKWNMIIINRQMSSCCEFEWIWIRIWSVAEEWHTIFIRICVSYFYLLFIACQFKPNNRIINCSIQICDQIFMRWIEHVRGDTGPISMFSIWFYFCCLKH